MKSRELTAKERRDIKALVCHCANYDKTENLCLPLDTCCFMLNKAYVGVNCKYFEGSVLPLNPRLEGVLRGNVPNTKPCGICGKQFILAGRKQYCSEKCQETAKKNANKERARKYRQSKG